MVMKIVEIYKDKNGKEPFLNWLKKIKDKKTKIRIQNRIMRLEIGQYGDFKNLSDGVSELRLHFGSGYRVYYGEFESEVVILLVGGDKGSQAKDIEKAKIYWKDVKENRDG